MRTTGKAKITCRGDGPPFPPSLPPSLPHPSKNFIPSLKTLSTFSMRPSLLVLLFTAAPTASRMARVMRRFNSTSFSC